MADNKAIGARIKNRRLELGLTLQEVADKVGVQNSTIYRYESGAISKIKMPVIEAIAVALRVNPAWLVYKTDDPTDYDDGELLAEIPSAYLDYFSGDAKKAYRAMKAAWGDAANERNKAPDTLIDIEGLSEDKHYLINRIMSLSDDEVRSLRTIVDQVLALREK